MTECQQNQLFCPLCSATHNTHLATDTQPVLKYREYWQCGRCELIFVPAEFFLSPREEKAIYEFHENNPLDEGYRRFLQPACLAVQKYGKAGGAGLDFGSGPGPTLSLMLEEAGFHCDIYDPYFAPTEAVWSRSYDFITSTEVFEHLSSPYAVIERLINLLKSGGLLVVMTSLWHNQSEFLHWSYKNDPTHICFYTQKSFAWIAEHFSLHIEAIEGNVILMRRPGES